MEVETITSPEQPSGKLRVLRNPAVISVIIALISLTVTFTGMNYQNITSWFSQQMFPRADFTLTSFEAPLAIPFDYSMISHVSTEYYVGTSISLKSEVAYLGSPLQFSILFENKGKKNVEQPRILIYATDFVHRIWCIWNESDADQKIVTKGCSLEYHFPPLDQKTIGAWVFYVLLYDDSNGQLVSYTAKEFSTTDVAPVPWYQNQVYIVTIIMYSAMGLFAGYLYFRKRRKAKSSLPQKKIKSKQTTSFNLGSGKQGKLLR